MKILGLILAAGESKRLGQPKQLLQYQGSTLLEHVINQLEPLVSKTHIILGAHENDIKHNINIKNPMTNPNWQQGMGSSLAFGIKNLPDCDAVLVALSDQILIPTSHYERLIATSKNHPEHIIATEHKSTGVPVIFPALSFNKLAALTGDQGAKAFINNNLDLVKSIACPMAAFDVDTPSDVIQLNQTN